MSKNVVRYYLRISDGKCFNYERCLSFIFNLQNAIGDDFKIDRETVRKYTIELYIVTRKRNGKI